jgi:hypothetical protein
VMLGQLEGDSTVLSGTWLGTYRGGVRRGYFKWHNTRRDGSSNHAPDKDAIIAELLASFTADRQRAYNDACRVAS